MRKLLVLAVLLGGAVSVTAQTQPHPSPPDPRFEASLVVTASLEEEPADRLSASVDVVDEAEISARQATNIAEILSTVPGLTVLRSGAPGKVTSLFSRGTESDHTLALWNGIKLNNPFFGGFDWALLPTEGVRRVEIVRGPFSAIHGGDALGGVVQVLTGSRSGGSLRLESGERGYAHAALDVGHQRGALQFDLTGHMRRGDGETENDFFDSEELAMRARWAVSDDLELSIVARANESENGIPSSSGQRSPERRIAWSERQVAVPVNYRRGQWEIDAQISQVAYDTEFSDPDDAFGFTAADTDSSSSRLRTAAVRRSSGGSWTAFGAEIERLEVNDRSVFGVNLEGATQTTRSFFVQTAQNLGASRLDVGLRHDDNDAFGSRTTPKLGLHLPVGERLKLRASWGEGFRAPSIGELLYPFSGNPQLEPEESESWEVGIERQGDAWRFGATAFDNHLRNLIDFDFVTFTNRNVGRARTRGVEAFARYSSDELSASISATRLSTEDRATGEPLLRRPRESLSMVVTAAPGPWALSVTGTYVGPRPDIDPATFVRVELESHVRFDIAGRYQKWRKVHPYARIENLANRGYQEVAGFPAPPRRWIGGLAYSWD